MDPELIDALSDNKKVQAAGGWGYCAFEMV